MRRLVLPALLGLATLGALTSDATFSAEAPPPSRLAEVPAVGEPGGPGRPLSASEMERWLRGRDLFDRDFHRADGLGAPDMNADSCRACHQDPVLGGAGGLELNVARFARDHGGAGPFENLPGGQVLHKLRPPYADGREEHDPDEADVYEQRQPPSLLGGGLIERIAEASILAHEDPTDADGDGVLGVARMIDVGGAMEIGRFGWKAHVPTLEDFIRDAMGVECGITTPDDGRGFALVADGDAVQDPELAQSRIDDMRFFLRELGPPRRTGSNDPRVAEGESTFRSIGCADCHVPSLETTDGQDVFLYSNLLLHNVMRPNFRGMAEPDADVGFYRTPPLWGVRDTAPYLHDGRAESLEDAILGHAGEATRSRQFFLGLPADRKANLVRFLEDL